MDHERVSFTFLATYQDGTTISAFAFDHRVRQFDHWRRSGHAFNEGRRNALRVFCRVPGICQQCCRSVPTIANLISVMRGSHALPS